MSVDEDRLRALIEGAWETRAGISPQGASAELRAAVEAAIGLLDTGALRVAEKRGAEWHVHQWLKKAVLLSFRLAPNAALAAGGGLNFYDKVPLKFAGWDERRSSPPPACASCRRRPCAAARSSPRTSC